MSDFPTPLLDPDQAEMTRCPSCGFGVPVSAGIVLGEIIWCDNCGSELEVVSLEPVRLDLFEPGDG